MSNVKQWEVKVQLEGGITQTTYVFAESNYQATQMAKAQFGDKLRSIHYVHEVR